MEQAAEKTLKNTLDSMILSPSGWRGIFCIAGDEEDSGAEIAPAYRIISAAAAAVFAEYLCKLYSCQSPLVILGQDTRPTGRVIADIMIRAFLASGCTVKYTGIAAAPEIMAYARTVLKPGQGGFYYISASHNPIGHNGLKFGLDDGGVLEGSQANKVIELFKRYMNQGSLTDNIENLLKKADEKAVSRVYEESSEVKQQALAAYQSFSMDIIAGKSQRAEELKLAIKQGIKDNPLGIAADFNGSARTISIDEAMCSSLGLGFHKINHVPGEINHAIIPEGNSLDNCCDFLDELHSKDPSVILGYMPDCDGDRGNLVIWDDTRAKARSLEAQEVFALACAAELAHMVWTGEFTTNGEKAAVVVNGPTSMRIDRIANAFGMQVFRAEVGEANVVNLARELRNKGYAVRLLGEGSNGGNITYPSSVRDPLATIFALVKLLRINSGGNVNAGFFSIWLERAKKAGITTAEKINFADGKNISLSDIIASLPSFYTTSVISPEAQLRVTSTDHVQLKNKYQAVFEQQWAEKKDQFYQRWGIKDWEARACIGTKELRNLSCFGDAQSGGLKIVFKKDTETAFIWMRGSKTEPVFRIIADAEDPFLERELIAWQRDMTIKADLISSRE